MTPTVDTVAPPTAMYVAPGIDGLNVRMGDGISYPVSGLLLPDAQVTGVAGADWLQISRGSLVGGWVSTQYLTRDEPKRRPSNPCPRISGRVTTSNQFANLRSGPGFGFPVVGRCAGAQQVSGSLVGSGPWIRTDDGFVNSGTITIYTADASAVNGRIPEHLLSPVPLEYNSASSFDPGYTPTTTRYLNGAALAALHRLQRAFRRRFGHLATIDLTYRAYDEQLYWYDKFGTPRAAVPGTSNHGLGLAIDFEERDEDWIYSWGAPANDWLLTHQAHFGFDNPFAPTLQEGEDYHFNFVG